MDFPAWYTPAPVDELGTPPEFNVDNGEGVFHCEEWHSWFRGVPAAPTIGETYVLVKAPSSTAVVVTDIDIELHRYRRWKRQGTIVQCGYGGDIFTATTASFSFLNNDSRVRIEGENGQGTVPPDQYRVLPGLAEVIGFAPDDRPGFYEWSMTIRAIIDQEEVVQQVGSEEAPLYSFVQPNVDVFEVLPAVDWDIAACEWVPADYSLVAPTGQRDWSCG